MRINQHHFYEGTWQDIHQSSQDPAFACGLVLAFGSDNLITAPACFNWLKERYPEADLVFASTSGEIANDSVYDKSVIATAFEFSKTKIRCVSLSLTDGHNSFDTGRELVCQLHAENLAYVMLISDGTKINGSELIAGFNSVNPGRIPVSGGLAGDGDRFLKTFTGLNALPTEGNVIAVGFYGKDILVGHGSVGGWDEFGHERTITRSEKNVLFEIDGKNALGLYKEYLGDYVNELPGSALLFPLALKTPGSETTLVRTILAIDENAASMTFAGNLPEGSTVRLMKANFDKLIEGSSTAAGLSFAGLSENKPDFALLISCIGRKLILQHRIDEEVEAAREIFGADVPIAGFYSYGEISPYTHNATCELHNQTMTITTFKER